MKNIQPVKLKYSEIKETFHSNKRSIFEEYVIWSASPENDRINDGIETQKQFAEKYGVRPATLSKWNTVEEFRARVRYLRDQWAFHRTGTVIAGIYRSAVRGNDKSQKLWMQVFEGFTEKAEVTQTGKVEIGENDIRFIINGLPEPMRTKYNEYITEIITGANEIKNARTIDDIGWDDKRPENYISDEADNDAQDVSSQRANVMAFGYTERICKNMERKVSENYHQSSKRWG